MHRKPATGTQRHAVDAKAIYMYCFKYIDVLVHVHCFDHPSYTIQYKIEI